jgi:hypothetical protein
MDASAALSADERFSLIEGDACQARASRLEAGLLQLHRIWSTDWWANPDREIAKLESALKEARPAEGVSSREQETASSRLGESRSEVLQPAIEDES